LNHELSLLRFFAEFILSGLGLFALLRVTRSEGLRMTDGFEENFDGETAVKFSLDKGQERIIISLSPFSEEII